MEVLRSETKIMQEQYNDGIKVLVADASHERYVDTILQTITDMIDLLCHTAVIFLHACRRNLIIQIPL